MCRDGYWHVCARCGEKYGCRDEYPLCLDCYDKAEALCTGLCRQWVSFDHDSEACSPTPEYADHDA